MKTMILLPTYNERANISVLLPKIFSLLPDIMVMVIDDNSPDGTAEIVKNLQATSPNLLLYERPQKEGLGRAYTDAFKKVLSDYKDVETICTMDADMSHDLEALPGMLNKITDYDLVVGSRYVAGGRLEGWEWHRKLLSAMGNIYARLVTKLPVHDCTSGFNCVRVAKLRQLDFSDLDPMGYAFLIHLKYKLWRAGARICEFPITFRSRLSGESKISLNIIEEGLILPWKLRNRAENAPSCPVCHSPETRYWFSKNGCQMWRCRHCRLIFAHPLPTETAPLYSEDYFCGARQGFGYINYDHDKQNDKNTFSEYLDRIEKQKPRKGALLDIGAATGEFLLAARGRGWQVCGVEISDFAAAAARKKELDVRAGTIESAGFAPSSFDVITLWDVFEHVRDPHATMEQIKSLLKPDGIVVLNLPDAGSVYAHLMGQHWPLIIPPEHLHLFNRANLHGLLKAHGLSLVFTDKIGKTYTPAYILQILHTVRRKKIWKKLSDWVRQKPINKISIPIHLRDNMFIIAKKI